MSRLTIPSRITVILAAVVLAGAPDAARAVGHLEEYLVGGPFGKRSVPTASVGQLTTIDLEALADAIGIPSEGDSLHRAFWFGDTVVVFSDHSAFVRVTFERDAAPSTLQMPHEAIRVGRRLHGPLADVAILIARIESGASFAGQFARKALASLGAVGRQPSTPPRPKPGRERPAAELGSIAISERANGYKISFGVSGTPGPQTARVAGDEVIVTIAGCRADSDRVRPEASGTLREATFDGTAGDTVVARFRFNGSISGASMETGTKEIAALIRRPADVPRIVAEEERAHPQWNLDVVVLDAGHGGHDPGAIGPGGLREKDVALGIVLKLGSLLERDGMKVVYTRRSDEFIELDRRGRIANEAGGKLFLSIHCNSMPTKPNPAFGFAPYILRPGKTDAATRVAERENEVIKMEHDPGRYGSLNEEQFIVASMAQSAFVRFSEMLAQHVQEEMARKLTVSKSNGVQQAGFVVLITPSMPNALIETGYISNTHEEKFLGSSAGQSKIAAAIASAVTKYRDDYEEALAGKK